MSLSVAAAFEAFERLGYRSFYPTAGPINLISEVSFPRLLGMQENISNHHSPLNAAMPPTQAAGSHGDLEAIATPSGYRPLVTLEGISLRDIFSGSQERGNQILDDYYAKFSEAFPDPAERPLKERIQLRMQSPDSPLQIFLFFVGDSLVGSRHFKVLEVEGLTYAVGEFTWVDSDHRRHGLGKQILQQTEQYCKARGATLIIGEFHDPGILTAEEMAREKQTGMDPRGRLNFWANQGYRQWNAPYLQPPVVGQSEWVYSLTVGCKVLDPRGFTNDAIPATQYLEMLETYWDTIGTDYRSGAAKIIYDRFRAQFNERKTVELIPLMAERTFRQVRE